MIRIGLLTAITAAVAGCSVTDHCEFGHWCDDDPCKVCRTEAELADTTEDCWNVECKDVSIPAVRFPWTRCDECRCGRVRTVHVLKSGERELQECEYDWHVQSICPQCGQQGGACGHVGSAELATPPEPAP